MHPPLSPGAPVPPYLLNLYHQNDHRPLGRPPIFEYYLFIIHLLIIIITVNIIITTAAAATNTIMTTITTNYPYYNGTS